MVDDSFSVEALATNTLLRSIPREDDERHDATPLDIDRISGSDINRAQGQLSDAATTRPVDFRRLPFDRLGICSVDPFAKYPFALNKRAQELMHLGWAPNTLENIVGK